MTLALSDNYGAALQTYGLAHAVKALGHDTEVYRYQNWSRITYGMSAVSRIKYEGLKIAKTILTQNKRKKRFAAFREKYIPLTQRLYGNNAQLRQDPGQYDVYISGSDQIWNPRLFVFDYSYFLDFLPEGASVFHTLPASVLRVLILLIKKNVGHFCPNIPISPSGKKAVRPSLPICAAKRRLPVWIPLCS